MAKGRTMGDITLKEFMDERDRRYAQRMSSIEESVKTAMSAQQAAISAALSASEKAVLKAEAASHIIVAVVVVALLWWALTKLAPPEPIARICQVLIVVVFVLWLLSDMGLLGTSVKIGMGKAGAGAAASITP